LVVFRPKYVEGSAQSGKICATSQSGQLVSLKESAAADLVLEVNTALVDNPNLTTDDPFDAD
jgi:glycine cleavage system H lipoate-binding protein